MISVYITCKDLGEAKNIAKHLLDNKLIACANMFPVESMFNWDGKLKEIREVAMLCKAKKENFISIEKEVKKRHTYDVPCIVAFDWVESNKDFSRWVASE